MNENQIKKDNQAGFTLIELLVVIAIAAIMFGLISINLGKAQTSASISTVTSTLINDIKNQQMLAMSGDSGNTSSQQAQGVYFSTSSYTLFSGTSYNSSDSYNYNVDTNQVLVSTTLPSNSIIFNKGDGSVVGFDPTKNTITLNQNGTSHVITINRYGATSIN